jgi:hypothetical protein
MGKHFQSCNFINGYKIFAELKSFCCFGTYMNVVNNLRNYMKNNRKCQFIFSIKGPVADVCRQEAVYDEVAESLSGKNPDRSFADGVNSG